MPMKRQIAVINAGSSSIKFAIFNEDREHPLMFRGQVEKIGIAPTLASLTRVTLTRTNGRVLSEAIVR